MLMSGALAMLLLLRGTVTAAICTAGVASNCEGAGSASCYGCCTALTCVWSFVHQWLSQVVCGPYHCSVASLYPSSAPS